MTGHEGLACISLQSGYWTWVTKVDRHFTTWATVKQIVPGVVIRDDGLWKANRRLDTSDARSTTAIAPLGIKWATFKQDGAFAAIRGDQLAKADRPTQTPECAANATKADDRPVQQKLSIEHRRRMTQRNAGCSRRWWRRDTIVVAFILAPLPHSHADQRGQKPEGN